MPLQVAWTSPRFVWLARGCLPEQVFLERSVWGQIGENPWWLSLHYCHHKNPISPGPFPGRVRGPGAAISYLYLPLYNHCRNPSWPPAGTRPSVPAAFSLDVDAFNDAATAAATTTTTAAAATAPASRQRDYRGGLWGIRGQCPAFASLPV